MLSEIFNLGNLIALIIGLSIGTVLFFYTPLGNRYKIVNDEGLGFYEVDAWNGDVRRCGPTYPHMEDRNIIVSG